jgi:hypothetical protein
MSTALLLSGLALDPLLAFFALLRVAIYARASIYRKNISLSKLFFSVTLSGACSVFLTRIFICFSHYFAFFFSVDKYSFM